MQKRSLLFGLIVLAVLFSAGAATAQQAAPVPPAIRSAQKIFISNGGAEVRIFGKGGIFSGDASRASSQLYAALNATGLYKLVDDPSEADLVLEMEVRWTHFTQNETLPALRLSIYDRRTHYVLWTLMKDVEYIGREKTRDHEFDDAEMELIIQFEQLTGIQATAH